MSHNPYDLNICNPKSDGVLQGCLLNQGGCIRYIQDKEFDDLIIGIIEIDNKQERRKMAKLLLLNENAKV